MARFFGKVGYGEVAQVRPGVHDTVIRERDARGDVLRNFARMDVKESVNTELALSNSVSILADAELWEHFHAIKYVEWAGARWNVTNVTVERPRLILQLGGVYNGPTP